MAEFLKNRHVEELPKKHRMRSVYAKTLCEKFKKLECPFTESADETWIIELLFKPGEPRIRILQWLLSKFHKTLYNFLDPIYSRQEARLKALLHVCSAIGLCRSTDLELIEGNTSMAKQMAFMDKLLNMVITMDNTESYSSHSPSKYLIKDSTEIDEQFTRDCVLIDSIVKQQSLEELFPPEISVLPIDVKRSLDKINQSLNADREERQLPGLEQLRERSSVVEEELARQSELFRQLQEEHTMVERDDHARQTILRKFRLLLSELQQMIVSYAYCYENHIQPWCNREAPELSRLGDKITAVLRLLNSFTTLIGALKVIKSSHSRLEASMKVLEDQGKGLKDKTGELDKLYETLHNLEETINMSMRQTV